MPRFFWKRHPKASVSGSSSSLDFLRNWNLELCWIWTEASLWLAPCFLVSYPGWIPTFRLCKWLLANGRKGTGRGWGTSWLGYVTRLLPSVSCSSSLTAGGIGVALSREMVIHFLSAFYLEKPLTLFWVRVAAPHGANACKVLGSSQNPFKKKHG